jgi:hypothetical protein
MRMKIMSLADLMGLLSSPKQQEGERPEISLDASAKELMGGEEEIEMLLDEIFGPDPNAKKTHFVRFMDNPEKPEYFCLLKNPKPNGPFAGTTLDITEAEPMPERFAKNKAQQWTEQGPCLCPKPDCKGKLYKAEIFPIPEGWVPMPQAVGPVQ